MDAGQTSLKRFSKVALAAMVALLILAVVCYKERVLFADSAFVVFHIVNDKQLLIQANRYGSFITQLFPYWGQKLHLPLGTILLLYGISFNLFFLSVVASLVYAFKQYGLAIVMSLYYFLVVSASYFWVVDEIHQAVAWMFLFFGTVFYLGKKQANIFLLLIPFLLLAFLAISTHFEAVIPTFFLWIYFILDRKNLPFSKNTSILLSAMILLVVGVKYFFSSSQAYDSGHLYGVTHFSLLDIINSFNKPVVKMFLYRCLVNYWCLIVVFVLGIARLLKDGRKSLAMWTVISCIGYIVAMGLTYGDLDDNVQLFHIESEWVCIGIIAATPFVFEFLPKLKVSTGTWLLAGIFITRLAYIVSYLPAFSARTEMKEKILSQMRKKGITKMVLLNDARLMSIDILDWGLPYESTIMSSMVGDKPQLTFLFVNPDDKKILEEVKDPKLFFDSWLITRCNNLNKAYYDIDSTKPYQIMTYEALQK